MKPILPSIWQRLFQRRTINVPRGPQRYRPRLEELETRLVPVTAVTPLGPTLTPAQLVATLLGSGTVAVSNIVYTGNNNAAGVFSGGTNSIGIESGVILSSGRAIDARGPNTSGSTTFTYNGPGDADLNQIVSPFATRDASVLEFDFVPNGGIVTFRYVFGSEEYNEFVGSPFNDVFAFYIDGQNVSVIPGTNPPVPVAINTVNNGSNSAFYFDNTTNLRNTQMDGFTVILPITLSVTAGQTHHIKLAIADTSDTLLDSAVFIADLAAAQIQTFRPLRYAYNRTLDAYTGNLIVSNISKTGVEGPLFAVLRNLPPGVTALNAVGVTAKGAPYFRLPGTGALAGKSTLRIPIQLRNPSGQHISTFFLKYGIEITGNLDDSNNPDPSGYVYVDANKNGARDAGEAGIPNVLIDLDGVTHDGQTIHDSMLTDADGFYNFLVMPGTYTLTEHQAAGYRDGPESLGTLGGVVENDRFTQIAVKVGDNGTDYDFGEWINHTPSLAVDDKFIQAGAGPLVVNLSAFDSDGDALTYSARLAGDEGAAAKAYQWKQELGLKYNRGYTQNRLAYGYNEKWLVGNNRKSYFILPDGELYRYSGRRGPLETHQLVGTLSPAFYNDPKRIWDATEPAARVEVIAYNMLVITPRPGFAGTLQVEAVADDGLAQDVKIFNLTVTNQAPQLNSISPQQISGPGPLIVDLSAFDADGHPLTFTAQLSDLSDRAYQLRQDLGLIKTTRYSINSLGFDYQEKWLTGSGRKRYLLLPDGTLYLYSKRAPLGGQTPIATLSPDYYLDPSLLWNAVEPVARIEVAGNQLSITPRIGWTGVFTVDLFVSDGYSRSTKSFQVTVT